jgi:hypothetical protein
MSSNPRNVADQRPYALPVLRFEIHEASDILRMSRAQVYNRIAQGGNQGAEGRHPNLHHAERTRALRRLLRRPKNR